MKSYAPSILPMFTLIFALVISSCTTPQQLVEHGHYDQAVNIALRRLKGKKKKKTKHVLALESAVNRANQRDMREADRLKKQGRPENWSQVNELYRRIRNRQSKVEPLLPLVSNEGIKANFRFVQVESLENESREKAAEYHYARAKAMLVDAQKGDKVAAREAYKALDVVDQYYQNFRDKRSLKEKARDLGTTRILVKVKNNANVIMPLALERDIRSLSVRDLNSFWQSYYTEQANGVQYDYEIILRIMDIQISPGFVKEREYVEQKRVQDGFIYIVDENGDVLTDSLGNKVTEPRYINVKARIWETTQTKTAALSGRLEIHDKRTGELIDSQPMAADATFENCAAIYRGDERALDKRTLQLTRNHPQPFPTDEALLFQAAEQLKPFFKKEITRARRLI